MARGGSHALLVLNSLDIDVLACWRSDNYEFTRPETGFNASIRITA